MTERAFPCCIACGARLTPSWLRSGLLRPKRWGYSLHFGGRGKIRRGVDYLVSALGPLDVAKWLGAETAAAAAAAVFSAALALQAAGWSLPWVMAEARELERLRWLNRIVSAFGASTATYEAVMHGPVVLVDRTSEQVEVAPRLRGGAVLEMVAGPIRGGATLEEK